MSSKLPAMTTGSRLNFVDLTRGTVMLIMIEVHVVNSMMMLSSRDSSWFYAVNFVNGLVAPSFIFISGFAFMLACRSKLDSFRRYRWDFWKQLGRIFLIWFLGYLLHIPYFSFHNIMRYTSRDQWLNFYGIDVLQCIAFGLLLIFLLRLWIKNDRLFLSLVAGLGLLALLPAPWIYQTDPSGILPLQIAVYLAPIHKSSFPLVPWFGFMAAGVMTASYFIPARESGDDDPFMKNILLAGMVLAVTCIPMMYLLDIEYAVVKDVRPQMFFFLARLGCVYLLLSGSYYYCKRRTGLSPIILYPSRESLAIYFLHLQILYREVWGGRSLIQIYPNTLDFSICLLLTLVIIAVVLPVAWTWNKLKTRYEYFGSIAVWTMIVVGAVIMALR